MRAATQGWPHPDLQPRHASASAICAAAGRSRMRWSSADKDALGADPVGLADHRQLRFPLARRFRAHPRRHQAAQRRVHVAQPAYRHRARRWRCAPRSSATPPRSSTPTCSSSTRSRSACAARCGRRCELLQARAARRWSSACATSWTSRALLERRMGAQERRPGAARSLRRDLGLRPAADLRSAGRASTLPPRVRQKMVYTGYLRRDGAAHAARRRAARTIAGRPFLLVTAGRRRRRRGADRLGAAAYEHDPRPALSGAARARPVHAARAPGGVHGARARSCRSVSTRSPSTRSSRA